MFISENLSLKIRKIALRILFAMNVLIKKMIDSDIKNSSIGMGS